jgi:CheY-like chemotaxis protein
MSTASSKLLVVDGESLVRKLLYKVLSRAGYEVQMARTAEEALETWGPSMCFDVVVSETQLSGMDGHEFARHMAVRCPTTRFIFVSGVDIECQMCPQRQGCSKIAKPFDPKEVVRCVAGLLVGRHGNPD